MTDQEYRARVEAERARLREWADNISRRCETPDHPTEEEMQALSGAIREFVETTPPELLWPEGVEPPPGGLLFGVLRTPEEWTVERGRR